MEQTQKMTLAVKKQLEDDLYQLEHVERPQIDAALEAARALGDLSENADYDAAKERFEENKNKIAEIRYTLDHAEIIDESKLDKNVVGIGGGKITLRRVDTGEEFVVQIKGTIGTDPLKGLLNSNSPIAMAISGHRVGDIVEVHAKITYSVEIMKIDN